MSNIAEAKYNIRLLEELSERKSFVHAVHPLAKVFVTLFFLVCVVSFGKYEASEILPLFLYPVLLFSWAEVPVSPILKRLIPVLPLVLGIGIMSPVFDRQSVAMFGMTLPGGWLTFFTITLKALLAVTAALLLIATTGIEGVARALRMVGIPGIFVLQLLLTYRYIAVLTEEVFRVVNAYSLRANRQRGIGRKSWGPMAGRLLIRTMDRSRQIYQAMLLRGFKGEYRSGKEKPPSLRDGAYFLGWSAFFLIIRIFPIPYILGSLVSGGTS